MAIQNALNTLVNSGKTQPGQVVQHFLKGQQLQKQDQLAESQNALAQTRIGMQQQRLDMDKQKFDQQTQQQQLGQQRLAKQVEFINNSLDEIGAVQEGQNPKHDQLIGLIRMQAETGDIEGAMANYAKSITQETGLNVEDIFLDDEGIATAVVHQDGKLVGVQLGGIGKKTANNMQVSTVTGPDGTVRQIINDPTTGAVVNQNNLGNIGKPQTTQPLTSFSIDENGNPVFQQGSAAQINSLKAQQLQQKIDREADKTAKENQQEAQKTDLQTDGIDNVLHEIDSAIDEAGFFSTGIFGAATDSIPQTPAFNLKKRVETIQANIGFDKLQQMRDASPTGGALGQVSERELSALQAVIANLDPAQGDERFIENMNKAKLHYLNWRQTLTGVIPGAGGPSQAGASSRLNTLAPADTGPTIPQTQADFDALPSGAIYIDPDDGKHYRKP